MNMDSLDGDLGSTLAVLSCHLSIHDSGYIWSQDLPDPALSPLALIVPGSVQPLGPERQKAQLIM